MARVKITDVRMGELKAFFALQPEAEEGEAATRKSTPLKRGTLRREIAKYKQRCGEHADARIVGFYEAELDRLDKIYEYLFSEVY